MVAAVEQARPDVHGFTPLAWVARARLAHERGQVDDPSPAAKRYRELVTNCAQPVRAARDAEHLTAILDDLVHGDLKHRVPILELLDEPEMRDALDAATREPVDLAIVLGRSREAEEANLAFKVLSRAVLDAFAVMAVLDVTLAGFAAEHTAALVSVLKDFRTPARLRAAFEAQLAGELAMHTIVALELDRLDATNRARGWLHGALVPYVRDGLEASAAVLRLGAPSMVSAHDVPARRRLDKDQIEAEFAERDRFVIPDPTRSQRPSRTLS